MRYPDPELLARRCIILTNKRGEPYVAYRANPLNMRAVWGKPVPYSAGVIFGDPEDVILTFENYLAPFTIYSPALQLTSDLPIDAPPEDIRFTPHPTAKVHTLLNYASLGISKALHQEWMVQTRNSSIERLYKRMYDRVLKQTTAFCSSAEELSNKEKQAVVEAVATLMCVSPAVVNKVLKMSPDKSEGPLGPRMAGRQHGFPTSISSDHAYKFKLLKSVVQQCRVKGGTAFILQDLYVQGEPGGFATRCPVLGVDLAWDESASYYAPRVGRFDTRAPFVSGNVLVMSMLARKMIEGIPPSTLARLLKTRPAMAEEFKGWTAKHPPVPNEKVAKCIAMVVTPKPSAELQKLVDDWND
jgi:hypothetical protein